MRASPPKTENTPECKALLVCGSGHRALALRGFLRQQGFVVRMEEGKRVIDTCLFVKPDFAVIDLVNLSNDDFHCCRQMRGMFGIPLLVIVARASNADQALVLESGADDVVGRDVDPHVLAARIAALLRRCRVDGLGPARRLLRVNNLSLDPAKFRAEFEGRNLNLSNGEFDVIWLLASLQGTVVSKDMLSNATRCPPGKHRDRSVDMFIYRLRQKIALGGGDPNLIRTVRGRGFMLEP